MGSADAGARDERDGLGGGEWADWGWRVNVTERRPKSHRWSEVPVPRSLREMCDAAIAMSMWRDGPIRVLSGLEMLDAPDGRGDVIPQWHVSISKRGEPPTTKVARAVLREFGIDGAEEDNHEPGRSRHFWMPVDTTRRVDCECKATERTVVEPTGHRWTTPIDGPCTGCRAEMFTGRPCTLHGESGRAQP